MGKKRTKYREIGLRSGQSTASEPDFLLSAAETARKRRRTFCVSLLCKERTKVFRRREPNQIFTEIIQSGNYIITQFGNALLGKTFKPDVLTKYRQKNDGKKAPIYYVEDTHPAIIPKDVFDMVTIRQEYVR